MSRSVKQLWGNGNGQKAYFSEQLWEHPALKNWDTSLFQGAFARQTAIHSNTGASCMTASGRYWNLCRRFFCKVLLQPPSCLLPLYSSLAVPTSPLCLCTALQHTCAHLPAPTNTAAFPHIPICPLSLAEQKPRWLTARRKNERDNDLF